MSKRKLTRFRINGVRHFRLTKTEILLAAPWSRRRSFFQGTETAIGVALENLLTNF
jgi:hypothetical protein